MLPEMKGRIPGKESALPSLWHRAVLERQVELEELRISVLKKINNALKSLEKKYYWDEAYLFGSVAQKGKFRLNSVATGSHLQFNRTYRDKRNLENHSRT